MAPHQKQFYLVDQTVPLVEPTSSFSSTGSSTDEICCIEEASSCRSSSLTTGSQRQAILTAATMKEKKSVRFGSVCIREFDRIIGDNPECNQGPPLTIDWAFCELPPTAVPTHTNTNNKPERLSAAMRREILEFGFGVSKEELDAAEEETDKNCRQRALCRKNARFTNRTQQLVKTMAEKSDKKKRKNSWFSWGRSSKTTASKLAPVAEVAEVIA